MAKEINSDLQEILRTTLEEAKKKHHAKKREEEEEEGEEEEEEGSKHRKMEESRHEEEEEEEEEEGSRHHKKKKHMKEAADKNKSIDGEEEGEEEEKEESAKIKKMKKIDHMKEETTAAASLHPAARSISDPKSLTKSKIGMMTGMMHMMNGMGKSDMVDFFNKVHSLYGPNKDWGVGNHAKSNEASIDMKASHAVSSKGPKTKMPMPKLHVKEDVEAMFDGQDLSEEFKENAATLFEAAVSARIIAEQARLEEEYETKLNEELAIFTEELSTKLDTYLDYVVENWMKENEVAIESTLRNELMEEFMEGLKNLFAEHYISVPQEKVDVLEALAEKVSALEEKLDESITENAELKTNLLEGYKKEIFNTLSEDLALTQQEKFAALVEGIEFDGNLETYEKKLKIIRENYFKTEQTSYSSNINEETFEGEIGTETVNVDPSVNRYVQAIARTVKK